MSSSGPKRYKKGDLIAAEGDSISSIFVIQTGKVKGFISRAKGQVDLMNLTAPGVIGEGALTGAPKHPMNYLATSEVNVYEIPIEQAKLTFEGGPQLFKFLFKGMNEQFRNLFSEFKTIKIENDNSPCSPEIIPRLFGGVFHVVNHLGKPTKDQRIEVMWSQMKQYTYRIFGLPQDKIENVCHILVKFGWCEYVFEKPEDDPEAIEQLTRLYFKNHLQIEQFFEFYQYFFFKSGKQDILRVDEPTYHLVRGLVKLSESSPADKSGNVRLELNKTLEYLKKEYALNITASSWQVLENKGLFSKRSQNSDGQFYISFALDDYQRTLNGWRFLREINKWNNAGAVDPKEPENPIQQVQGGIVSDVKCPECGAQVLSNQKFCGECGAKLTVKAA